MCVSVGKKCLFFGNFGVLCFLETPVLKFALLPYYRQNKEILSGNTNCPSMDNFSNFHISLLYCLAILTCMYFFNEGNSAVVLIQNFKAFLGVPLTIKNNKKKTKNESKNNNNKTITIKQ